MNSVKISKMYKTVSSVPLELEVNLDFRGHSEHVSLVGMSAMDSLTLKMNTIEIVKIHKTVLML